MKIFVKVKPNAREEHLTEIKEHQFIVAVTEPPVEGRANAAIMRILASHFSVPSTSVRIISGYASRQKIVEIIGKE
jgi:uncharacterized protein (TIGR00251 family)